MDVRRGSYRIGIVMLLTGVGIPVVASALSAPSNVCIDVGGTTVCESRSGPVKWNPGHYGLAWAGVIKDSFVNKIAKEKYIKGLRMQVYWRQLEPKPGVYDFSIIEENLSKLQSKGKRLLAMISYKSYNSAGRDMLCAPEDIIAAGGTQHRLNKGGKQHVCVARIWRKDVRDRFISLMKALGSRFDKEPYFEGVQFQETANNGGREDVSEYRKGYNPPYVAGFTQQKYFDAIVEINREAKKAFPHTNVFQMLNHIQPPSGIRTPEEAMRKLISALYGVGVGISDPDLICCSTSPNPAVRVRSEFVGKLPMSVENQTISKRWSKYRQTPDKAYFAAVDDPKGYHANYVFWWLHGSNVPELDYGSVINTIERNGGRINTACPANVQCGS